MLNQCEVSRSQDLSILNGLNVDDNASNDDEDDDGE